MAQLCNQLLPRFGTGYRGYKGDETRYGTAFTVNFILQLGMEWHAAKPTGPRLLISDLSPKGGGKCPNGGKDATGNPTFHKSHDGGWDFDVQLVRADGQELVRSVKITDSTFDVGPMEKACELGELQACWMLGNGYLYGHRSGVVTPDPVRAVQLYQKGCDGGEAGSCASLSDCYSSGEGVTKNKALATKYRKRAEELGYVGE